MFANLLQVLLLAEKITHEREMGYFRVKSVGLPVIIFIELIPKGYFYGDCFLHLAKIVSNRAEDRLCQIFCKSLPS